MEGKSKRLRAEPIIYPGAGKCLLFKLFTPFCRAACGADRNHIWDGGTNHGHKTLYPRADDGPLPAAGHGPRRAALAQMRYAAGAGHPLGDHRLGHRHGSGRGSGHGNPQPGQILADRLVAGGPQHRAQPGRLVGRHHKRPRRRAWIRRPWRPPQYKPQRHDPQALLEE